MFLELQQLVGSEERLQSKQSTQRSYLPHINNTFYCDDQYHLLSSRGLFNVNKNLLHVFLLSRSIRAELVGMVNPVPDRFDFPKEEEEILKLWKKLDAFRTSLKQSKDRPKYTFYDGPPFATGLPHYGHILAGTIKV